MLETYKDDSINEFVYANLDTGQQGNFFFGGGVIDLEWKGPQKIFEIRRFNAYFSWHLLHMLLVPYIEFQIRGDMQDQKLLK